MTTLPTAPLEAGVHLCYRLGCRRQATARTANGVPACDAHVVAVGRYCALPSCGRRRCWLHRPHRRRSPYCAAHAALMGAAR